MMWKCVRHYCAWGMLGAGLCATALGTAKGQVNGAKAPAFDVVSIRQHRPGDNSMSVRQLPDGYRATNFSLRWLIQGAYDLRIGDLLIALPGWADSERYDIDAKMDAATAEQMKKLPDDDARQKQMNLMLQAMLADRCNLKVHRGTKVVSAYALVVGKGGFKLKPADAKNTYADGIKGVEGPMGKGALMLGDGTMTAQAIPISMLAANLQGQMGYVVEDRTGISGRYDISLKWKPDRGGAAAATEDDRPSLFTAIQDELGLKLVPVKLPMDTVIVDHIERPSAN